MKKEPLYVTMRSKENDWIEDSLRIKEAKNVAGHNLDPHIRDGLRNNGNATQHTQSPTRKESNYANKQTEETSTTKLEESQYVGICQRFPPSTRNKRMNLEEEKKSEHHVINMSTIRKDVSESKVEQRNGPDKTSNGSHQLQTEGNRSKATEGSFFDCDEERRGGAGNACGGCACRRLEHGVNAGGCPCRELECEVHAGGYPCRELECACRVCPCRRLECGMHAGGCTCKGLQQGVHAGLPMQETGVRIACRGLFMQETGARSACRGLPMQETGARSACRGLSM